MLISGSLPLTLLSETAKQYAQKYPLQRLHVSAKQPSKSAKAWGRVEVRVRIGISVSVKAKVTVAATV